MPNAIVQPSPLPASVTMATGAAGSVLNHALINSLATTNATLVDASPTDLFEISLANYSAAAKFFKLYNKASAPTVGTDIPVLTIALAANSEKVYEFGVEGKRFNVGLAYAITNLQPVADITAVAAGDVIGSMSYA